MKYRSFPGTDITTSALGMGCMRLPTLPEEGRPIDEPAAIQLIRDAIDGGITYIDTAYGYHNEQSERLVGKALKDGYRERVTLTTKLPVWKVEKADDMERILDEQLERLQVDHLDFYLLHSLGAERYDFMRGLGAREFLERMQAKGKIRYPGFSFHDDKKAFEKIATDYDWKLAQVQMNLLDEFQQATYEGAQNFAAKRGIGLVVMEPLRGGALVNNVPKEVQAVYDSAETKRPPVEWAFRWLLDKPEFVTILSGMSNSEQLQQNLRIFDSAEVGCLSDAEKKMLEQARAAYESRIRVGCTGCEYCMPCPFGVKIPNIFRNLDRAAMFDTLDSFKDRYRKLVEEGNGADKCMRCGKCEAACPQHIAIRDKLAAIGEEFGE